MLTNSFWIIAFPLKYKTSGIYLHPYNSIRRAILSAHLVGFIRIHWAMIGCSKSFLQKIQAKQYDRYKSVADHLKFAITHFFHIGWIISLPADIITVFIASKQFWTSIYLLVIRKIFSVGTILNHVFHYVLVWVLSTL